MKSTASILIDVLDVDDNAPEFEKKVYTGKLHCFSHLKTFNDKIK